MARLILSLDGQVLAEYNMNKERYTIGRLPDNDIRIDNPAVSGHHSLIINILNDSFLEDLNSTNGTYVNGKLIKKHALQHGDVITVRPSPAALRRGRRAAGRIREDDGDPALRPPGGEAARRSRGRPRSPAAPSSATGKARALAMAPPRCKKAKLQVLSGAFAGRELELSKALTTLGRPGVQVAAITRRSDGYYIVHVDSGKPDDFPLVNGTPIGAQRHQAERQRRDPAGRRQDGLLRQLIQQRRHDLQVAPPPDHPAPESLQCGSSGTRWLTLHSSS